MMSVLEKMIILGYVVLLTGCIHHAGEKTAEEIGSQVFMHQAVEVLPDPKWREMPDIEVPYIPELGYHQLMRIRAISPTDYVCWKDLLVIGNKVYRRKNGIYERTEERPQDWFDIDEDYGLDSYDLKQYENILIAQDVANSKIILYDMDTSKQISEYSFDRHFECVCKDKIYYSLWDEGIFRLDPLSGKIELVYACDDGYDLMIRDDGDMLIVKGDRSVSDEIEFWLLSHDEQGDLSAKKIWETDEFEYMETAEFNARGLFILGVYNNHTLGGGFYCLKDNGEVETVVIEKGSAWARSIITEEGYFLWDSQLLAEGEKQEILFSWDRDQCEKTTTVVDSISYYDFQGNKLGTWRLIDDEMLEAGYRLVHIVYGNGAIYAFYENEELDDLYISKIQVWEESVTADGTEEIDSSEQSMEANETEEINTSEQSIAENRTGEFVRNPYFYDKEEFFLQATAKYHDGHFGGGMEEQTVYIQVDMLQTYEEGSVYKFTVDIGDINERDYYLDLGWLDFYFYVTKDRIYSVTSAAHFPDIEFNLNDNADILTEIYDTDEKLVEWSTIVCQEDEMIEDQESVYRSITKEGSQVTYYAYMTKWNGEVGWSLYYTWQEGKGLVSCGFRHGPGEGYDLVLDEIEEIIVVG